MFAYDISVLISDSATRELQIKIDRVVTELETSLNRNDLVINTGKTGVISRGGINDQQDATVSKYLLLEMLYMFRAIIAHHQELGTVCSRTVYKL
jgi:hypothetical protein